MSHPPLLPPWRVVAACRLSSDGAQSDCAVQLEPSLTHRNTLMFGGSIYTCCHADGAEVHSPVLLDIFCGCPALQSLALMAYLRLRFAHLRVLLSMERCAAAAL